MDEGTSLRTSMARSTVGWVPLCPKLDSFTSLISLRAQGCRDMSPADYWDGSDWFPKTDKSSKSISPGSCKPKFGGQRPKNSKHYFWPLFFQIVQRLAPKLAVQPRPNFFSVDRWGSATRIRLWSERRCWPAGLPPRGWGRVPLAPPLPPLSDDQFVHWPPRSGAIFVFE